MKKLIIQIPCYNEADTLPVTLQQLPKTVDGFDQVEWLVIDDGSKDGTATVARELGVDHVISFPENRGLAKAFTAGLRACCVAGADVIVNTDADNQYDAHCIPKLATPILKGEADIVIGERPIESIEDFSWIKKKLQRFGSKVMRLVSHSEVKDAPSGFRAFTRDAAMRINVFSHYTYTLETIIQAGLSGMRIQWVKIETNPKTRNSRLVKSIRSYITRSMVTMFSILMIYRPVRTFVVLGCIPFALGTLLGLRWMLFYSSLKASNIPSLILAAIFLLSGFHLWMLALISHLLSVNRMLMQDIQYETRKLSWKS